jgi:two-component sensor histidine kinase/HAMP domain-containing protein
MLAFRDGNFSVRLPPDWEGVEGQFAAAFNQAVSNADRLTREASRLSRAIGREGRLKERLSLPGAAGCWADKVDYFNRILDDLARPMTEISQVIGAVAKGDLGQSMSLEVDGRPLKGEFLRSAKLVNAMIEQLAVFASEVTRVAREVGTEGKLGGQAEVTGASGVWKELTESVNQMAGNLTAQVRNIADVTIAVASGDLSKKITVDVRGEILLLKQAINTMVDQLRSFASEVTRVAREVGTDGRLGGQAVVPGVAGTWTEVERKKVEVERARYALEEKAKELALTSKYKSEFLANVSHELLVKQRQNTANVPIIFLTAYYNEDQHVLEGYGAGAVDYLLKPVNPTILRAKVAAFAELYRKQRNVEQTNRVLQAEVASRRRAEDRLRELNDTLEQRVAERTDHISQLLKEMDHRSKNLLNVVQAIARQTAVANPGEFMTRFSERIQTLAASHDLLVKSRWQGIGISDLIGVQLGHFSDLLGRRIKLDGPPLRLSVEAAQTLSMILHELATNAAKYGALSNDSGRVDIRWSANGQFTLGWAECGGPNVVPPNRRGFGSTVVKAMAESNLDGQVDLDFAPVALRWRVVCPASKVLNKFAHYGETERVQAASANSSGH